MKLSSKFPTILQSRQLRFDPLLNLSIADIVPDAVFGAIYFAFPAGALALSRK
ncbi:hypothetical protein ACMGDH_09155 [Sphingomonas sp. DT-207]